MSPSRPFILRPIATSLFMAGILLVGIVAYRQLPVSALPQVDYPTIQVITFYPGASPDVMASSVTAPLEKQFGQVPAGGTRQENAQLTFRRRSCELTHRHIIKVLLGVCTRTSSRWRDQSKVHVHVVPRHFIR